MADPDTIDARTQRAILADMRQKLVTPATALVGYGELLCESAERSGSSESLADLRHVLTAARQLLQTVNALVDEDKSLELFGTQEPREAERKLRHDLRTPINAIKGYAEMLLEDLEGDPGSDLYSDLETLLTQTDRLLDDLDDLVSFTMPGAGQVGCLEDGAGRSILHLIGSIGRVDETTLDEAAGRILVVDDIAANRELLKRRLTRQGHSVETAAGGREALLMMESKEFDLVLLDLMMPDINGFEVLKRMKSDPNMRDVPVIMVSALNETDSVIRCVEAGANDYLLKPIDPVMLKARIKSGLESKRWSDDEREKRRYIRQAFSRFVSPAVVDQLIDDPDRLKLGGERTEITCVFTDLAGFTSLVENTEPARVLPVLNRYLDGLCRVFLGHDGTIDKIVGDALHGFFGAPLKQTDHAARAMKCVLDLDEYARWFVGEPQAAALGFGKTRIGVHTGVAVVGNFGGELFFDYTAHGDVINTASRMEAANKQLGTTVCVSGDTASRCPGMSFRPIGHLVLRGKDQAVEAFEPVDETMAGSRQYADYLDAFELMRSGKNDVGERFRRLASRYPEDALIALHARRLASGESGVCVVVGET